MTSPAARMYAALHQVACDNDSAGMRAGLAHGDYTSDTMLALEDERIFQRSWVCLGHEADIGEPGDYAVEAILDHEVLLIGVGLVWCIRHMYPRTVAESTYHYRWYATGEQSADAIREYAAHHAATTGAEDAEVVAGAQRGMRGDPAATNVLLCNPARGVGSEHVIAYFHDLVRVARETP